MRIEVVERYSIYDCRDNPEKIFVFGDNLARFGRGGQATIRLEANAFGVPTKRAPYTKEHDYFHDKPCEREHVLAALRQVFHLGKDHTLVLPRDGIGTGLAKMPEKSPLIFAEMCDIFLTHFGYRNGQ